MKLRQTVDEAWAEMRMHLELRDGIAVFFVFADQARALKSLRLRLAKAFDKVGVLNFRPEQAAGAAALVLGALDTESRLPESLARPIWIDLTQTDTHGEVEWEAARSACLARLNESREWVIHSLRRILVIALPAEWRSRVGAIAPDLWHVRTFTAEVHDEHVDLSRRVRSERGASRLKFVLSRADVEQARSDVRLQPSISARRELAMALLQMGRQSVIDKRFQEARDAAQEAVDLLSELGAVELSASRTGSDLQAALMLLGDAELGLGQVQAAVLTHARSVAICRDLTRESTTNTDAIRRLIFALVGLADAQQQGGEMEAALQSAAEALQLQRDYLSSAGASPQARLDLAKVLGRVADLRSRLGQDEAALQALLEQVALCRVLQDELGDRTAVTPDLVFALMHLAQIELCGLAQRRIATNEAKQLWEALDRERFESSFYDGVMQAIQATELQLSEHAAHSKQ